MEANGWPAEEEPDAVFLAVVDIVNLDSTLLVCGRIAMVLRGGGVRGKNSRTTAACSRCRDWCRGR